LANKLYIIINNKEKIMSGEALSSFNPELTLVGGLVANWVGAVENKIGLLADQRIIGDDLTTDIGARVNLIIATRLHNAGKPTWFGIKKYGVLLNVTRDDESDWPNGIPYGAGFLNIKNQLVSDTIITDQANTGGWDNLDEHKVEEEAINLLGPGSNGSKPTALTITNSYLYSYINNFPVTRFYFAVEPAAYAFHNNDYLIVYAMFGGNAR
jgi:hypothetical protein